MAIMTNRGLCGRGLLLIALLAALPAAAAAADPGEPAVYEARGVVKARQRAVIATELAALVKRMPLRPGESFHAGDLLVGFDCRLFEAQKEKVQAELEAARMRLENSRQLKKMSSIGVLEVQLAEIEVKKSEAEARIVGLNVERCAIKAPYAGRVVRVMANEQESVKLQQELLEIVGVGSLEAEIVVPGAWIKWLTPGRKLTMTIDETGEEIPATVSTVAATMDPASQSLVICARVQGKPGSALIPGMRGLAHFAPPNQP
jgi:RND family efflux transporter MFP subunit